jgi:single-stranded-DNA-specific exonuclease
MPAPVAGPPADPAPDPPTGRPARKGPPVPAEPAIVSPPRREWVVAPPHPSRVAWADRLRVSPITAQVLLNRVPDTGRPEDLEAARRFLRPDWGDLHDPDLLPDMEPAADRLARAVRDGERIVVYGDYDVDGITGTSLLWHGLKLAGADADYYVPHRIDEGYGLHADALAELHAAGARVVVSVDCGTTAVAAAERARELGLDLIVTDHHEPGPEGKLPPAVGVVNPKRADSRYPDAGLCGAGVAFKLAWAVSRKLSGAKKVTAEFREYLVSAMGLAALATIADVVPLTGENRTLAAKGLLGLPSSRNVGVRALLASAGLDDKVDDYHAGYLLGPRLNAAGRMGHAKLAVELFTTASPDRAAEIARYLEAENDNRRRVEQSILHHARNKIAQGKADPEADRCIVLADEDWHPGVVGIVAGRLVEEFGVPVILLWVKDGLAGGSARSVEGFNLFAAIDACRSHLIQGGGHAMAAGMKMKAADVEPFAEAFRQRCRAGVTEAMVRPRLRIDSEVLLPVVSESLVGEFGRLAPFGNGNPRPVLACFGATVMGDPRTIKEAHLSFHANQAGRGYRCMAWRRAADWGPLLSNGVRVDLAFAPKINEFNGRTSVELEIKDLRLSDRR